MNQETAVAPPLGKIRHPLAPFGLGLVTCGIYNLVWMYKTLEEMRRHAPEVKMTSGGLAIGLLFVPFFNIFWMIYLWFRLPSCVGKMQSACGITTDRMSGAFGFIQLIPIVGGILWSALIQSALNAHWRAHLSGAQSPETIAKARQEKTLAIVLACVLGGLLLPILIAILSAISVPFYIQYIEGARASDPQATIGAIYNASKMYQQDTGVYPTDLIVLEQQEYLEIDQATKEQWNFQIIGSPTNLEQIMGTSTEKMKGGAGQIIIYNVQTGKFTGYGLPSDQGGE